RLVDRKVRAQSGRVLAGGGYSDRPLGHHDGRRGVLSGECACFSAERGGGRVSRFLPAPCYGKRNLCGPGQRRVPRDGWTQTAGCAKKRGIARLTFGI